MSQEPYDAKVQQIRDAGKRLFLLRGFHRTSTAALAKEAGISKETLYSRYDSKEAILADVLQHLIPADQMILPRIPRMRTEADLRRALSAFARELRRLELRRDFIELARIVVAETPALPELGRIFRDAVPQHILEAAEALLDSAFEAGLIADVDRAAAARLLVGPVVLEVLMNGLLVAGPGEPVIPHRRHDPVTDLLMTALTTQP